MNHVEARLTKLELDERESFKDRVNISASLRLTKEGLEALAGTVNEVNRSVGVISGEIQQMKMTDASRQGYVKGSLAAGGLAATAVMVLSKLAAYLWANIPHIP